MMRKVDELGRIVLPIEYREALNIRAKDDVNLNLEKGKITIQKNVFSCHFCGASTNLVRIGNECFCKSCIQRLHEAKEGDVLYPLSIKTSLRQYLSDAMPQATLGQDFPVRIAKTKGRYAIPPRLMHGTRVL